MFRPFILATTIIASPAIAASSINGYWTNPARNVTVRIAECGKGVLCGRVVRASDEAKAKAAAAGTHNLIGAELMSDLKSTGQRSWHGNFFIPDRNIRADGDARMVSQRILEIEGCALGGLMCKSQQWTRTSAPKSNRRRH